MLKATIIYNSNTGPLFCMSSIFYNMGSQVFSSLAILSLSPRTCIAMTTQDVRGHVSSSEFYVNIIYHRKQCGLCSHPFLKLSGHLYNPRCFLIYEEFPLFPFFLSQNIPDQNCLCSYNVLYLLQWSDRLIPTRCLWLSLFLDWFQLIKPFLYRDRFLGRHLLRQHLSRPRFRPPLPVQPKRPRGQKYPALQAPQPQELYLDIWCLLRHDGAHRCVRGLCNCWFPGAKDHEKNITLAAV